MKQETKTELLQYYNCIRSIKSFKNHLNYDDEFYYKRQITNWIDYKNKRLLEDEVLSQKKGWLKPFNNRLENLMLKLVYEFKQVLEWKENNTDLHPKSIEAILNIKIDPLKEMVTGLKMNYDHNTDLACRMQRYCINGFELMVIFIKDNLLINIKDAPCYYLLHEAIEDYRNAIDCSIIQPPKTITIEELFAKQNNLIPSLPIANVYNHFKILIEITNKHNEFYLTPEQLYTFILSTFVEMKPVRQKFNCSIVKKDLRKIFYNFYFTNKLKEKSNQTKLKRKYFDIMDKGFFGFKATDYNDFHV